MNKRAAPAATVETQNEIRVKVAELCGWRLAHACHNEVYGSRGLALHVLVPDYPNDLNACAKFEETLTDDQWLKYLMEICKGCGATWRKDIQACAMPIVTMRSAMSATAEQRCRAFEKTVTAKESFVAPPAHPQRSTDYKSDARGTTND